MGIEAQSVRLLLIARAMGVEFAHTLTIGRQNMMVDERQVSAAFRDFGTALDPAEARAIAGTDDVFSPALFTRLGAGALDAMDISDYEGARVIQDLNQPLDPAHAGRFSAVFDGGTLEHVFNCTTAMQSYMQLPRVGGHLILALPSNNEMGHGFYQFSPEFFFRTLAPEHGYRVRALFLVPMFSERPWLLVRDPAQVRARVGYNGWRSPTYIFVVAERIAEAVGFGATPQQSDYAAEWDALGSGAKAEAQKPAAGGKAQLRRALRNAAPKPLLELGRELRHRLAKPDGRSLARFEPRASGLAQLG